MDGLSLSLPSFRSTHSPGDALEMYLAHLERTEIWWKLEDPQTWGLFYTFKGNEQLPDTSLAVPGPGAHHQYSEHTESSSSLASAIQLFHKTSQN